MGICCFRSTCCSPFQNEHMAYHKGLQIPISALQAGKGVGDADNFMAHLSNSQPFCVAQGDCGGGLRR